MNQNIQIKAAYHNWSAEEASYLTKVTEQCKQNGKINWERVSKYFPNNHLTQLKSYFQKELRNKKIYYKWTREEERELMAAVEKLNKNWAEIQLLFPSFSLGQLTSKYQNIMKQRRKQNAESQQNKKQNQTDSLQSDRELAAQLQTLLELNGL